MIKRVLPVTMFGYQENVERILKYAIVLSKIVFPPFHHNLL